MHRPSALLIAFTMPVIALVGCGLSITGASSSANDGGTVTNRDDASSSSSSNASDADVIADTSSSSSSSSSGSTSGEIPDAHKDDATVNPQSVSFGQDCNAGTVYEDDFATDPTGRWFVVAGQWTWDATAKTYAVTTFSPTKHALIWIGPRATWKDYIVEITLIMDGPVSSGASCNAGPVFRIGGVGNIPAADNDGQMYLGAGVVPADEGLIFGVEDNAWDQRAAATTATITKNALSTVTANVKGQAITISANGQVGISLSDTKYAAGSIGIKSYDAHLTVKHVKVTCL